MRTVSVMIVGEKESFLIRTLVKKLKDSGFEAYFCNTVVDKISAKLADTDAVIWYLDGVESAKPLVAHFLDDHLADGEKSLILIGEKNETNELARHFKPGIVSETFPRPLQTEQLIEYLQRSGNPGATAAKKTILIVDDDPAYMGVIRDWLRGSYKVAMANSGLQAIKWLGANSADLILLDFEMPVTSGPQVLEMLRSEEETASIPVFFLTGRNDKESVMQVVSLKPENYLLKTIQRDKLLEVLGEFFRKA
ncbi:MAG: response regulator [Lachnospiraceae bacterium]|nr:response regulator [Lachnospiraceae bacterium]MBR5368629.1 response regulator [Lachnospiraceae bacterium]